MFADETERRESGKCYALAIREARDRRPFYGVATLRPALVAVNTKGARSRPAGHDQVGRRQVRTRRNEQNGEGPNRFLLQAKIANSCSQWQ